MKKISLFYILISLLSCSFWACKEDDIRGGKQLVNDIQSDSVVTLATAKNWFENDYLKNSQASLSNNRVRKTFWERAFMSKMSNGQPLVVVPIEHHKAGQSPNRDTYLWIFKDDFNRYTPKVIEYLSRGESVNNDLSTFTGAMTVRDWEGRLLNGFIFKDGMPAGLLKSVDGEEQLRLQEARNGKGNGTVCDQVWETRGTCTDYYYKVCINGNCTDYTHNGTFCELYEITYPKCYWVEDFPGQTSPYGSASCRCETMLPGDISLSDYEGNYVFAGPKVPITNLTQRFKNVFGIGADGMPKDPKFQYKLTIYIDQPIAKTKALVQTVLPDRKPGHTYLGLEQYNSLTKETKRLVFGFYVQKEWKAGLLLYSAGAWGDDGGSTYDISVSSNLTADQAQKVYDQVAYIGTPEYHITERNCTSVAAAIMNPYVPMPSGKGEIGPLGLGMTPGALGQDIYTNTSTYGPYNLKTGDNLIAPTSTN
ncbi:hypothetical protein [Dyadobacter sp. BHUBP1]|uniref:hypothetical protein n=1 Tax=Dyadobacter sp. BHUBP1 TaxID=3424178 RepID=UPI003D32D828